MSRLNSSQGGGSVREEPGAVCPSVRLSAERTGEVQSTQWLSPRPRPADAHGGGGKPSVHAVMPCHGLDGVFGGAVGCPQSRARALISLVT